MIDIEPKSTIIEVNYNELQSMLDFAKEHRDETNYQIFRITQANVSGIGSCTNITCKNCKISKDITDYDCW